MIRRITGVLDLVAPNRAEIALAGGPIVVEALLPTYLVERLSEHVGKQVTLETIALFDSPNQGATFTPRLLGFGSASERQFFELLTSVKGLGPRKALRAMGVDPANMASAIVSGDARALTRLPEIGKRLAETLVVELSEKAKPFADPALVEFKGAGRGVGTMSGVRLSPAANEAVEALISLGESRPDAERKVAETCALLPDETESDAILAAAFARR